MYHYNFSQYLRVHIDIVNNPQMKFRWFIIVFMTDPILIISMVLGLGGVLVLINSFSDDDDSDNDGGTGTYLYDLQPVKVGNN